MSRFSCLGLFIFGFAAAGTRVFRREITCCTCYFHPVSDAGVNVAQNRVLRNEEEDDLHGHHDSAEHGGSQRHAVDPKGGGPAPRQSLQTTRNAISNLQHKEGVTVPFPPT